MGLTGLSLGTADTLLTQRAADYLASGPADPQALITHVCQINGASTGVAEHMAAALFAGHQQFTRTADLVLDEQAAHAELDAVALVRRHATLPERLRDNAEHRAAVELLAARLDGVDAPASELARFNERRNAHA